LKKTTEDWLALVKYDMETAEAMLKAQRYIYVLFCCQQAIEKALKACLSEHTAETPPYIHNLVKLRQLAFPEDNIPCDDDFLRELSAYYIQSRYLVEMIYLTEIYGEVDVEAIVTKTKDLIQWLIEFLN